MELLYIVLFTYLVNCTIQIYIILLPWHMFTVCYVVFRGSSIRQTENFTYKETSINIVFIYNKLAIDENLNRVEITPTQKKMQTYKQLYIII